MEKVIHGLNISTCERKNIIVSTFVFGTNNMQCFAKPADKELDY